MIDLNSFTPLGSLAGGVLIGAAAAILLLGNGRIAGISGILGGILSTDRGDRAWRVAFLAGMLLSPTLYGFITVMPEAVIEASTTTLIVAGLLVGLGTRYASGCTSGHGVCGLSRGSVRSLTATLSFMGAGFLTVYLTRHVLNSLSI
jgi:uncharacterized membrane protein YedE/YeeE